MTPVVALTIATAVVSVLALGVAIAAYHATTRDRP